MATRVARSDPLQNGGLFNGRRATAVPSPVRAGAGTSLLGRCVDHSVALVILGLELVLVVSMWGPQPLGWVWVASQVSYLADSLSLGLLAGFAGTIVSFCATVAVLMRLDRAWKLVRRAAGCEQREGALERLFVAAFVVFVPAFLIWFFMLEGGGGSMIFPAQPS